MREYPTLAEAEEAADLMCDKEDKKPGCCDDSTCQRACWVIYGYSLSQCCKPGMQAHTQAHGGLEGREALNALRGEKGNAMKTLNINWLQLAQFVLQMVLAFLAQPPVPPVPPQQAPPQAPPQGPAAKSGVPKEPREHIRQP